MRHDPIRVKCTCTSPFQDSKYGQGMRVGTPINNSRKSGSNLSKAGCTVCGKDVAYAGK